MSYSEIKQEVNVDHYANVCRDWRIEKSYKKDPNDEEKDFLIVHSGTDGVSIATRASNNSFIHLETKEIESLIKELKNTISFSKDAKATMQEYWDRKNGAYGFLQNIKKKFE